MAERLELRDEVSSQRAVFEAKLFASDIEAALSSQATRQEAAEAANRGAVALALQRQMEELKQRLAGCQQELTSNHMQTLALEVRLAREEEQQYRA